MSNKITIQDMADELGLSRNTVSKILNGKYTGPDDKRNRVLQKAIDVQYKGYGVHDQLENKESDLLKTKNIMILSKGNFKNSNFFSNIIDGVQKVIRESTCNIMVSIILEDDLKSLRIPPNINKNVVDGIICIEVFSKAYIEKLLALGIPLVFVDFYYSPREIAGKYDVIMMDNEYNVYELTKRLIDRGLKKIGFVGDTKHCRGFHERFKACRDALRDAGIYNIEENSIIYPNGSDYFDVQWMERTLLSKKELPEAFVCANDSLAVCTLRGLQAIGKSVPNQVELISFDNALESELINPKLTTVGIFKYDIGIAAAENLLLRIQEPERKSQIIYVQTEIIERDSTMK